MCGLELHVAERSGWGRRSGQYQEEVLGGVAGMETGKNGSFQVCLNYQRNKKVRQLLNLSDNGCNYNGLIGVADS